MTLNTKTVFILFLGCITQAAFPDCELPSHGIKLKNGHHLKATKPHCLECDCDDGSIQCASPECDIPECGEGFMVKNDPNKCCGHHCVARPKLNCELPQYNIKLNHGQHLKATKPHCLECDCNDGHIRCKSPQCAMPRCAVGFMVKNDPNKCCGHHCVVRPKLDCELPSHNIKMKHGQHLKATKPHCLECDCNDGHIKCKSPVCAMPRCAVGFMVQNDPTKCCGHHCVARKKLDCELPSHNIKMKHGQHLAATKQNNCLACDCNDGHIKCKTPPCAMPGCAPGFRAKQDTSKCCSFQCVAIPKRDCELPQYNIKMKHGQHLTATKPHCLECDCNDGHIKCKSPHCVQVMPRCQSGSTLKPDPKQCCRWICGVVSESMMQNENLKYYTMAGVFGFGLIGIIYFKRNQPSDYEHLMQEELL